MSILELMEKYNIELTKQGNLFVAFCVFHRDENRPNFTVYPITNSYFCFSCNRGGDAIDFFARMENLSRSEAMHKLYSDLRYLIDKLNKKVVEASYTEIAAIQVGKQFNAFLSTHLELLSKVLLVMQYVDKQLLQEVSREKAMCIINETSNQLNKLIQSRGNNEKNNINL